jgi:outer membrane protein assembly factor BamB
MLPAFVFLCIPVSGQEWTRFRGPNGTGESETEFPAQWGEGEIEWKVKLPGFGHGSPVLWEEKIFLLSADPQSATRYLLCLDASNGKELWRRDFPSSPHKLHRYSSYASSTPALDAEAVYIAWSDWGHMNVAALDHSGRDLWQRDLGVFVNQHGFGSSPMLYQDLVVVNCSQEPAKDPKGEAPEPKESFIVALEKGTGKERWRLPRQTDTSSYSVPCVRQTADRGEELLCCSTKEGVFAIDPKTGKENWSVADAFSMRTVSSPVMAGGHVFGSTGSGGGGNYVVACKPGENADVVYEIKTEAPYVPTPVAKGDLLFLWADKKVATCIDAASGKEVWQHRVSGREFFGSPVRAGSKIFCIDDTGLVVCIAADSKFKELGKTDLKEECRSTPAIAGGKMYVRTGSHLYCIGGEK